MRSVKISDLTGSLSDYAREGLREPIVVTRKGKPVMAVMPLTKYDDWESFSLAVNPRFMESIERSRASARVRGCIPLEEGRLRHGLAPRRVRPRKAR